MPNFENFYNELLELVKRYEKNNIPIKVEKDLENNIIKIFGEQITSLARAKNGLNDVSELAFATAEHHPFGIFCTIVRKYLLPSWKNGMVHSQRKTLMI
ncbi:MAG: hypothetical protein OEM18_07110 [Nitrosopumilus sp.]|nr:hypothetical protein [Nitrosopumilus sp.]